MQQTKKIYRTLGNIFIKDVESNFDFFESLNKELFDKLCSNKNIVINKSEDDGIFNEIIIELDENL